MKTQNDIVELTAAEAELVEGGLIHFAAMAGYYAFCLGSSYAAGFLVGTGINALMD